MDTVCLDWMTRQYKPTDQYVAHNPYAVLSRRVNAITPQKMHKKMDKIERQFERSVCFY